MARWFGCKVVGSSGLWQNWASLYVYDLVLVAIIGAYGFLTRRRLHPAFVAGSIFALGVQVIAHLAVCQSWWKPVSIRLVEL